MRIQTLITAPANKPVSVLEAKDQLRVTFNDDDMIIDRYINAATAWVEQYLQRKLITQTWNMFLDSWPTEIEVLFGDLQSVTHVKYTDSDEAQATFTSDDYLVDTDSVPGRIVLKDGETWPTDTLSPKNPIEIQFVTGYGDNASDVLQDIRDAIILLVAHKYSMREPYLVGVSGGMVPLTIESLLYNHRVWPWVL